MTITVKRYPVFIIHIIYILHHHGPAVSDAFRAAISQYTPCPWTAARLFP